jgi:hypothetical protein
VVAAASVPLEPVPIPRTRLIGRESERAAARSLLLEEAVPLLTLTGPGGGDGSGSINRLGPPIWTCRPRFRLFGRIAVQVAVVDEPGRTPAGEHEQLGAGSYRRLDGTEKVHPI